MPRPNYRDLTKEQLVQLLEARDEKRFGLVWERDAIEHDRALNEDFVVLDPVAELHCGPAPHANLVIEGDNFDALRALRPAFAGKVDLIAIDPPYNTGNRDFVYNDRYVDKEDGWRHSKWLEFMFQRLSLARDLLAEHGAIFVHIDDNEASHLRLLMDEVFGEKNFVACCVWQKRYSRENREAIGDAHEYVLIYSPDPEAFKRRRNLIPLTGKQAAIYKNPNHDPMGRWRAIPMTAQGFRPNQMYEIHGPDGTVHRPPEGRCWSMIEPEFVKLKEARRVYWGKNGKSQPSIIRYLREVDGFVPWTWWPHEEVGHTDEARKEIQTIFGTQTAFTTPKPVRLIERILQIATRPDSLVLDFFAGSGTTGHAVMKLNAEDGGRRRYILVSSTEATAGEPEKNLCRDVCAERLRRVVAGYGKANGEAVEGLGGGFAYLKARRIPMGRVVRRIGHGQVWLALQLMHFGSLAEDQPVAGGRLHVRAADRVMVCYAEAVSPALLGRIEKEAAGHETVVVYSWQPDALAAHLPESFTVLPVPQSLVEKFRARP